MTDDMVVGDYSPYPMQAPIYQAPQYSMPPVGPYQYPQQTMMGQPPCATCQNQAAQNWQTYPPTAPLYQQPSYPPVYSQQPAPPQNWQQPQPAYQYPQPVTPPPALPQPPQPAASPATTSLQPIPAPAAQVSYLPGYSLAVPPVRQAYR